ncbi:MAG: DUF1361 domain-containing protein [Bacteroidota bacterium]
MPLSTHVPFRRLWPTLALVAFTCALLAARIYTSGSLQFAFLVPNLALALVPLAVTSGLVASERLRGSVPASLLAAGVWLLFLPNAPYLLTDLIHLRLRPDAPFWFDLVLLLSGAGAGLAAGYRSLLDMEELVADRFGERAGRGAAIGALFLSAFGIYLGRFLRLNSWEAVTAPALVFGEVFAPVRDPLGHLMAWQFTLVFVLLLTLGYLTIRASRR